MAQFCSCCKAVKDTLRRVNQDPAELLAFITAGLRTGRAITQQKRSRAGAHGAAARQATTTTTTTQDTSPPEARRDTCTVPWRPPAAPSPRRAALRRRSTRTRRRRLTHPPGSSRPAAPSSLLPWRTLLVFGCVRRRKKEPPHQTRPGQLQEDAYSKASNLGAAERGSAPGWPGSGGMNRGTSKLFQDSPASLHHHMGLRCIAADEEAAR